MQIFIALLLSIYEYGPSHVAALLSQTATTNLQCHQYYISELILP